MSELNPYKIPDNVVSTCVLHHGGAVKYHCDIDTVTCERDIWYDYVDWSHDSIRRVSPFIEMTLDATISHPAMSADQSESPHLIVVDENGEFEYVIELMNVEWGHCYSDPIGITVEATPIHQDHPFWSVNIMQENDDYDGLLAPDLANENHCGITMKRVSPPRPSDYPDNGTYGESEQVETRIRTGSYSPNKHWPSQSDSDTESESESYSYRCTMTDCTECVSIKTRHDVIRHECSACGRTTQFTLEGTAE